LVERQRQCKDVHRRDQDASEAGARGTPFLESRIVIIISRDVCISNSSIVVDLQTEKLGQIAAVFDGDSSDDETPWFEASWGRCVDISGRLKTESLSVRLTD
jgi:hypothetical protein